MYNYTETTKQFNQNNKKNVTLVLGTQYGDEGKGKITASLAKKFDIIVRPSGGPNAGHTVCIGTKKFVNHIIPSGITMEGKMNVIGSGTVIDPKKLLDEMESVEKNGVSVTSKKLVISNRAIVILTLHVDLDAYLESLRDSKIGTTHSGIGPAYASRAYRNGVRMYDLKNWNRSKFELMVKMQLQCCPAGFLDFVKKVHNVKDMDEYLQLNVDVVEKCVPKLKDFICDTRPIKDMAMKKGLSILIEGAQAYSLDNIMGTYPFNTSSLTGAAGNLASVGIGPRSVKEIIGIVKCYTSRVGAGPFVGEKFDEQAEALRKFGNEYGSTTGRPRKIADLNAVQVRQTVSENSITGAVLTMGDNIGKNTNEHGKVCAIVAYKVTDEFGNVRIINYEPIDLDNVEPVIVEICDGWKIERDKIKSYDDLPNNAKIFIKWFEDTVGVEVKFFSFGKDISDMIQKG